MNNRDSLKDDKPLTSAFHLKSKKKKLQKLKACLVRFARKNIQTNIL